jgi:hypothetical protein
MIQMHQDRQTLLPPKVDGNGEVSMSNLFLVLGILFVLSFVPLVVLLAQAYFRYRGTQVVTCPDGGAFAKVRLDAMKAAFSSVSDGPELAVTSCERWPEHKDCAKGCVGEAAPAPGPVRAAAARREPAA